MYGGHAADRQLACALVWIVDDDYRRGDAALEWLGR